MTISHRCVWALIAICTLGALLAPLLDATPCHIDMISNRQLEKRKYRSDISPRGFLLRGRYIYRVPPIGESFVPAAVSGGLLAVLLDPDGRLDVAQQFHRWVCAYTLAVVLATAVDTIGRPWLFAVCPGDISTYWYLLWDKKPGLRGLSVGPEPSHRPALAGRGPTRSRLGRAHPQGNGPRDHP